MEGKKTEIHNPGHITLLDFLVMNAPPPPPWWKPEMESRPSYGLTVIEQLDPHEKEAYRKFYIEDDDEWVPSMGSVSQDLKDKVAKLRADFEKRNIERADWDEKLNYESLVQWPFYYAKHILIRRMTERDQYNLYAKKLG